jgi:hypothetical protein
MLSAAIVYRETLVPGRDTPFARISLITNVNGFKCRYVLLTALSTKTVMGYFRNFADVEDFCRM